MGKLFSHCQQPVDLSTLTEKINVKAEKFVAENAASGKPFFLYLPFHQTHHPQFAGMSARKYFSVL